MKPHIVILFIVVVFVAQIVTWFQLNLQFLNPKFKDSYWLLLTGIPITWLFMKATSLGVEAFNGEMWPQRLISFATGILIFTVMTHFMIGESLTIKNVICLGLAVLIVLIQIFYK
jgi:hypothetical protein